MDTFTVFVYGTLKCGFHNHELFCSGHLGVEPALVRGRVLDRPEGCPILFVPPDDFLLHGTADHARDVRAQKQVNAEGGFAFPSGRPPWSFVRGEAITLDRPKMRFPALDSLEDFSPGRPSVYCRVLLPTRTRHGIHACWAYISPHSARAEAEVTLGHNF